MDDADPAAVTPFRLPLPRRAFQAALERGHGRALLHLRAHPELVRDEDLLPHLLFDPAYDSQLERREGWRERTLEAVDHRPSLVEAFIQRSVEPSPRDNEWWDTDTRGTVLLHLAHRGVAGAAEALRSLVQPREHMGGVACLEQVIEFDAEAGLLLASERALSRVDRGWIDEPDDSPLECWDHLHGDGSGRRVLQRHADRPGVQRYLDLLGPAEEPAEPPQRRPGGRGRWSHMTGRDIRAFIEAAPEGALAWPLVRWGREAPDDDLREVATGFAQESNPRKASTWSRVWTDRGLPVVTDAFLAALADPAERHRWTLFRVAGFSIDVRHRPLDEEERSHAGVTTGSLARYGPWLTDADLPEVFSLARNAIADPRTDADARHRVNGSLLHLAAWNPGLDASSVLLLVYATEACGTCRRKAVKHLHRLGRLPAWIREECLHDASEDVREFAESVDPQTVGS